MLNRLWRLAGDRFNYLTPTKKPIGFASDVNGKRKRLYDTPKTPPGSVDRRARALTGAGSRTTCLPRIAEPGSDRPPDLRPQVMLLKLAKDKTEQLYLASFPSALPDIRKGIRVKAS